MGIRIKFSIVLLFNILVTYVSICNKNNYLDGISQRLIADRGYIFLATMMNWFPLKRFEKTRCKNPLSLDIPVHVEFLKLVLEFTLERFSGTFFLNVCFDTVPVR